MKDVVIVLIVFVIFVCVVKFAFYKKEENMRNNGFYSFVYVTKIYEYGELGKPGGVGASLPAVDFFYELEGKKYNGRCSFPKSTKEVKVGDKFLLLISKKDTTKYMVLFEYPVKDSIDLEKQIRKYKKDKESGK